MRFLPNRTYASGMRWCIWRWTDVDPEGDGAIYLTRLHLFQIPLCSVMLHWISKPDPQPDLHDHPTTFLSIVLSGWYEEEIPGPLPNSGVRQREVSIWNFKRATDRHRITSLGKTVLTLVFAGPVVRQWGFWTNDGWEPWRSYVARRRSQK